MAMFEHLTRAAPAAPEGAVKETTTQTFVKDVLEESKRQPVLVDFWAEWCGPCKQLAPVLEKVVKAAKGKVKLVKMDIDKHPQIPGQLGIQSIPAVFAFVNGQPVDGFLGVLPESQIVAFLERITKDRIGGEEKDLLKAADDALGQGDAANAADLYAKALGRGRHQRRRRSPGSRAATCRPARSSRPSRRSRWCPRPSSNDAAVAAARAALELVEQAQSVGPDRRAGAEGRGQPDGLIRRASISRSR